MSQKRQRRSFYICHRKYPPKGNLNTEHLCPKYKGTLICKRNSSKPYTVKVEDFNTPLSSLDRSNKKNEQRNNGTNRVYDSNELNRIL